MKVNIIAAIGKNRELGKDNKLLWHLPEDLKRFKQLTDGHPIIMGRKTFESIGRVLPNRTNIIITRNQELRIKSEGDVIVVNSLNKAIERAKISMGSDEIFIIGGGQIFEQALALTDRLYLTIVDKAYDADAFFPAYDDFVKVRERAKGQSGDLSYEYVTLDRV